MKAMWAMSAGDETFPRGAQAGCQGEEESVNLHDSDQKLMTVKRGKVAR